MGTKGLRRTSIALLVGGLGYSVSGMAFEISGADSDVKIRWDNTVKYTAAYRLKNPSEKIAAGDPPTSAPPPGPQLDDGDRNFKRGLINNRFDLFSEFDVTYKNFGMRVSGAAWYDEVYNRSNDNTSGTVNSLSVPAGTFTREMRNIMGRYDEILDAFVFVGSDASAETPFSVRAGKHTVLYGESLFFGSNGIANAQAPVDVIKLLSIPGSQFKEIIRPVGQVSTQIQFSPQVSAGAYYQYEWQKSRLPASGSYFSDVDFVGPGSEAAFPGIPPLFMTFAGEKKPDAKQFGLQARFRPSSSDIEYGVYAAQYNDKTPQVMLNPAIVGGNSTFQYVYAEKIKTVGASFSTVAGEANIASEVSYRWNAPLVSDPQMDPGLVSNGTTNPLYAVGKTAHVQISAIYLMGKSALWEGADLLAELAWNRRLSIEKNPLALDPNTSRDAMAFRMIFTPQYFQVLPGLDLSVPIGLGFNPYGNSSAVAKFNGGAKKGGDFSIGLKGDYMKKYKVGLNYTHFFGKENAFLTPNTFATPSPYMTTGAQSLRDRDFVSLSVQTTF